jgi:hypothetical protein
MRSQLSMLPARPAIKVSTPWAEFEQARPDQLAAEPRDEF